MGEGDSLSLFIHTTTGRPSLGGDSGRCRVGKKRHSGLTDRHTRLRRREEDLTGDRLRQVSWEENFSIEGRRREAGRRAENLPLTHSLCLPLLFPSSISSRILPPYVPPFFSMLFETGTLHFSGPVDNDGHSLEAVNSGGGEGCGTGLGTLRHFHIVSGVFISCIPILSL